MVDERVRRPIIRGVKKESPLFAKRTLLEEEEKFKLIVSPVLRRQPVRVLGNSLNCEKIRLIPGLNCRYCVYRAVQAYFTDELP